MRWQFHKLAWRHIKTDIKSWNYTAIGRYLWEILDLRDTCERNFSWWKLELRDTCERYLSWEILVRDTWVERDTDSLLGWRSWVHGSSREVWVLPNYRYQQELPRLVRLYLFKLGFNWIPSEPHLRRTLEQMTWAGASRSRRPQGPFTYFHQRNYVFHLWSLCISPCTLKGGRAMSDAGKGWWSITQGSFRDLIWTQPTRTK